MSVCVGRLANEYTFGSGNDGWYTAALHTKRSIGASSLNSKSFATNDFTEENEFKLHSKTVKFSLSKPKMSKYISN